MFARFVQKLFPFYLCTITCDLNLQVASELVTKFKHEIDSYLDLVVNTTENELGRCGPMANVYKSVVEASCSRIVNPLVCFVCTQN